MILVSLEFRTLRFQCLALFILLFLVAGSTTVLKAANGSDEPISQVTCEPDVWLINTRSLGCPRCQCGIRDDLPTYSQVHCRWTRSSTTDFVSTLVPETVICVFIDGNRIEPDEAAQRGQTIRRRFGCCGQKVRFVIWSWPSDRIHGPMRDARAKIRRADHESYYLASWLAAMPTDQQISVTGYSLGARVVTAGVHMLGGGQFRGNRINVGEQPRVRPRMILLGAAISRHWLMPGQTHGLAMSQAGRSLSLYNSKDRVLKFFPWATENKRQEVLGYRPISNRYLDGDLRQFDMRQQIGNSHDIDSYTNRRALRRIRPYALFLN